MALLPQIAAGVEIEEMQVGLSVRLREVFYDNGSLASGGRTYFDTLSPENQARFRSALRARRQLYQERVAEPTAQLAQQYQQAFAEIEPVLDRYALNEEVKHLAREVPAVIDYLTKTYTREAWLQSLTPEQQTRVRDAIADRHAIRNVHTRLGAASEILANPAIDVASAAEGIGRNAQDLMRLFTDSGPTERCRQLMLRLPPDRVATIERNFQLRNSRRAAMSSPAFSLSIPATPASGANFDLDLPAWQAQLMGVPSQGTPAAAYTPESSFRMPPTPSGGWQWDLNTDADAGPSNGQDDATSAAPPYSREFSLSIPATPASDADLHLDAWRAQLMGAPAYGSPAQPYTPESSFAMPATPSGGWQWDLNEEGSPHGQDDVQSVPPPHSPAFSLSVPATPASDANLNVDAWRAQLMARDPFVALLPSVAAGIPIGQINDGQSVWLRHFISEEGNLLPQGRVYVDRLSNDDQGRVFDALALRQQAHRQPAATAAAEPTQTSRPSRDPFVALLPSISAGVPIDRINDGQSVWLRHFISEEGDLLPQGRVYIDRLSNDDQFHVLDALRLRRQAHQPRAATAAAEPTQSLSQRYQNAFSEIEPVLDHYALHGQLMSLAEEAPSIRRYLTKTGLHPRHGEAWLTHLSENAQARVRDAIADRTAIHNLREHLVQISELLANPANDLGQVAASIGADLHDLLRLFNDSGLTERGAQYLSRRRPEQHAQILQNLQLRNSQRDTMPAPTPESSFVMPATPSGGWHWDHDPGEGTSHWQDATTSMPRAPSPTFSLSIPATPAASSDLALNLDEWQAQLIGEIAAASPAQVDPHEALRSIVGDLGRVPVAELQQRINVPLDEYFVPDEGITEKGFRFLKTLSEEQQTQLQLALAIPRDVMAFHEINALIDRYEVGVANAELRRDMPNFSSFLTEGGSLGRSGGTVWFRHLPPGRQARIALAIENRQIINAIGPRFVQISSTFSNPANDMDSVARRGRVTAEQLARFLTEDGLTPLGQRFLATLDNRTRQLVEANLALRRA